MSQVLQKASSALLALLLTVATGWPGLSLAESRTASKPVCKCCDYDPANCATPACCARPADNSRAPVAPAAPCPTSGTERHAIAATPLAVAPHAPVALHEIPFAITPVHGGAVPIFQRNCSFLI